MPRRIELTKTFAVLRDQAKKADDDTKSHFLQDTFTKRGTGVAMATADYLWPTAPKGENATRVAMLMAEKGNTDDALGHLKKNHGTRTQFLRVIEAASQHDDSPAIDVLLGRSLYGASADDLRDAMRGDTPRVFEHLWLKMHANGNLHQVDIRHLAVVGIQAGSHTCVRALLIAAPPEHRDKILRDVLHSAVRSNNIKVFHDLRKQITLELAQHLLNTHPDMFSEIRRFLSECMAAGS